MTLGLGLVYKKTHKSIMPYANFSGISGINTKATAQMLALYSVPPEKYVSVIMSKFLSFYFFHFFIFLLEISV